MEERFTREEAEGGGEVHTRGGRVPPRVRYLHGGSDHHHFIDPLSNNQLSPVPADVDYVHYLLLHYRHCVHSIKLCPISDAQNTNRKTHFLSLTISTQCHSTRVAN